MPVQSGSNPSEVLSFYSATPITQPTNAAQAAIVDNSGGTANPTTGVVALTGTYNSTILANAIATNIALTNQLRLALVNLGLIKGS